MKKLSLALFLVLFGVSFMVAQRSLSGTVTDSNSEPLIGASVLVKGTTVGTVTDIDGRYTINVPAGSNTLVFSYTGFAEKEVALGASNVVNVELDDDIEQLSEVVVTALGVEREKKELSYAVSTVDGGELTKVRSSNPVEALNGRVAGLRVNSSSGTAGGSVNILIRGANSLGGGNDPLFVVDGVPISNSAFNGSRSDIIGGGADVGNRGSDINPDDIESISVLKGGTAVALYGQRARDGVILIKTKRAKTNGLSVDVNTSYRWSSPLRTPDYQNEYAQGDFGIYEPNNFTNGWGPNVAQFGDTPVNQFPFDGEQRPLQIHPDNVDNFFETGTMFVNNVAVSSKGTNGDIRISHTYMDDNSFVPANEFKRHNVSVNAGTAFTEKLRARAIVNYVRADGFNRPRQGSNNPSILLSNVYGLPRTVSTQALRDNILDENGDAIGLNGNRTVNNPYYITENNPFNNSLDRIFGNVELNYGFTDWLTLTGRLGTDFFNETRRNITSKGTLGALEGNFIDREIYRREINTDLILRGIKDLNESFSLDVTIGWNTNDISNRNTRLQAADLLVAEIYNPANAQSVAAERFQSQRRLIGGYFNINLGYNDYLFLNLTGRNDWTSTLAQDNNSFFYPGAGLSFVFTDAFEINPSVLTFGKLRASWASVGSDTGPYQLLPLYTPGATIFTQFVADNTLPHGGASVFFGPNVLPAGNALNPQQQETFEVGTELQFFNGRFGVDLTYYNILTKEQILDIQVPQSTGFESVATNIGSVRNAGIEALVTVSPVMNKDWNWDVFANVSINEQTVEQLAPGLDDFALTSGFSGLSIRAEEGEEFGLYGNGWDRVPDADGNPDPNGAVIINETTGLREAGGRVRLGDIFPDWQLGVGTTVRYKSFSISALVDASFGGVMFSRTASSIRGSGLAEETLENRGRIFVDEGVNAVEGADGQITYVPNQTPVRSMQEFWGNYTNNNITEGSIFDADFVKLREILVQYTLPNRLFENNFIRSLSIGIEARNLWLIDSEVPHVDPEASFFGPSLVGGGANIEFFSIPSARSFGLNLRAKF